MDLAFKEKRALVTGSSAGIGAAIARTLAREGASTLVHARDRARTEGVARAIRMADYAAAKAAPERIALDGNREASVRYLTDRATTLRNRNRNELLHADGPD